MYTKKTLRRMYPTARKIAVNLNDIELAIRRINKLLPAINDNEKEVISWQKRQEHFKQSTDGIDFLESWPECSILSKISRERG